MIKIFNGISYFFEDISKINFKIPYQLTITFIILVVILITGGVYIFSDSLSNTIFRNNYMWYYIITLINLINIMFITFYYHTKKQKLIGDKGITGKSGMKGRRGKFLNCNYCKTNLFVQKTNRYGTICTIYNTAYNKEFGDLQVEDLSSLFYDEMLDFSSFANDLLRNKPLNQLLVSDSALVGLKNLYKNILNLQLAIYVYTYFMSKTIGKSTDTIGSFIRAKQMPGYMLLGDSINGGIENFKLNSFMISSTGDSNIVYPDNYEKLVTFDAYEPESEELVSYSIWRSETKEITTSDALGNPIKKSFHSLGDICYYGNNRPPKEQLVNIESRCLKPVKDEDLKMIFLHLGNNTRISNVSTKTNRYSDYTKEFKIDIKNSSTYIEFFSVWRTPLNTFITNYNDPNDYLVNNTIAYNIINGRNDKINKYGNVSFKAKKEIINRMKKVPLNHLQVAIILINHYNSIHLTELKYYLTKSDNEIPGAAEMADKVTRVGEVFNYIEAKQEEFDEANLNRMRTMQTDGKINPEVAQIKEKEIPKNLIDKYTEAKNKIYNMDSKIDNITTLYDLFMEVFPNGLDERIALDNQGIAEGGEIITSIQELVIKICKVIFPPKKIAYMIKDDCLGFASIDSKKRTLTVDLEKQIRIYNKYMKLYKKDPTKYCNNWEAVTKFQDRTYNIIGQYVGHIDNYIDKIERLELEEFTKSRIEKIIESYIELNKFIAENCNIVNTGFMDELEKAAKKRITVS